MWGVLTAGGWEFFLGARHDRRPMSSGCSFIIANHDVVRSDCVISSNDSECFGWLDYLCCSLLSDCCAGPGMGLR